MAITVNAIEIAFKMFVMCVVMCVGFYMLLFCFGDVVFFDYASAQLERALAQLFGHVAVTRVPQNAVHGGILEGFAVLGELGLQLFADFGADLDVLLFHGVILLLRE